MDIDTGILYSFSKKIELLLTYNTLLVASGLIAVCIAK